MLASAWEPASLPQPSHRGSPCAAVFDVTACWAPGQNRERRDDDRHTSAADERVKQSGTGRLDTRVHKQRLLELSTRLSPLLENRKTAMRRVTAAPPFAFILSLPNLPPHFNAVHSLSFRPAPPHSASAKRGYGEQCSAICFPYRCLPFPTDWPAKHTLRAISLVNSL